MKRRVAPLQCAAGCVGGVQCCDMACTGAASFGMYDIWQWTFAAAWAGKLCSGV